jgi:hypothetical protein
MVRFRDYSPIIEAPDSRAAPVKLWTRCNRLSLDFAGLVGALVPLWVGGVFPKLNDMSPVADPGAGGGGIFGGPPTSGLGYVNKGKITK